MCLFGSGSAAASAPAPPPSLVNPTNVSSTAYQQASATTQQRAALAEGQGATNFYSPTAAQNSPTTAQKTLLGQ